MQYDPVTLFDIDIYKDEDGDPALNLSPSDELLKYITKCLDKYSKENSGPVKDDETLLSLTSASIIEYALSDKRKN